MTTRKLSGTYTSGYSLSANYSKLVVDPSAVIGSTAGAAGNSGEYATGGGAGGIGVTLAFAATKVVNGGAITGGYGGRGGDSQYVGGEGEVFKAGAGGAGGAGLDLARYVSAQNTGTVTGGAGGDGGWTSYYPGHPPTGKYSFYAGNGGAGGDGLSSAGGADLVNRGRIVGGHGGVGGTCFYAQYYRSQNQNGVGGQGGVGVYLVRAGAIKNFGTIIGGQGGAGGGGGGYLGLGGAGGTGGAGIELADGGRLLNAGLIVGGEGGVAVGFRDTSAEGGTGVALVGAAKCVNSGTIVGGQGGKAANGGTYAIFYGGLGGDGLRLGAGASLSNNDTIIGGQGGDGHEIGGAEGIDGDGGYGVYLVTGASLFNDGVIEGGQGGVGGDGGNGGAGVFLAGGKVSNMTSITGGEGSYGGNGDFVGGTGGAGLILLSGSGYSNGVIAGGIGGNGGNREGQGGTGGDGVDDAGAFYNSGQIVGGDAGYGGLDGQNGQGGCGAVIWGNALLTNTGTIVGGLGLENGVGVSATGGTVINGGVSARKASIVGIYGVYGASNFGSGDATTVINFGTIKGTGGQAVELRSLNDRLIVEAGCVFDGAVYGGHGALEFAAGKGKLNGLGAAFEVFDAYDVDAGGSWALSGETAVNATFSIATTGTVVAMAGEQLTVGGPMTNNGRLVANGGQLTVDGAVSGAGEVVFNGGTVVFASTFSQAVRFEPTGGELELADAQAYDGEVSGFSTDGMTTFDLRDIGFVNADEASFSGTQTGGVLTVSDGTHTAHIALAGDYIGATFTAASDGDGGATVAATSGEFGAPLHAFIAAIASLTSSPAHVQAFGVTHFSGESLLTSPRVAIA